MSTVHSGEKSHPPAGRNGFRSGIAVTALLAILVGGPALLGAFFWHAGTSFQAWLAACEDFETAGADGTCSELPLDAAPPGSVVAAATCPRMTKAEAIEAAIAAVVERGRAEQAQIDGGSCPDANRQPGTPCLNSLPYSTAEAFKAANPGCCETPEKLAGDDPLGWRPFLQGRKQPKLFLVAMRYKVHVADRDGKAVFQRKDERTLVTCEGHVLPGLSFALGR